jgi:hypothetical protein
MALQIDKISLLLFYKCIHVVNEESKHHLTIFLEQQILKIEQA